MTKPFPHILFAASCALTLFAACTAPPPAPFGPTPTPQQVEWQRMEINMFCHFGPNTFSGAEWGSGREDKALFAPSSLDCRQWVEVAAQAGMGGIILTAKHHDGFCLWPSKQSTHTVPQSMDVLRALRTAVDNHDAHIKMGVYISPWDRNHPSYGTTAYNDVFVNTLKEVHTQYGPLFEQWFDGACGEGSNGKRQAYDWPRFFSTMDSLNASCILFSDIGPGCRWVGNEEGRAGTTCWSTLNTDGATPSDNKPSPAELEVGHSPQLSTLHLPLSTLNWVPAEVDVSIRPGWFWHPNEHPKTVDELMEIYFNSVGRNGLLLLNVPPDTAGRICAEDSTVLVSFRAERDRIFARDLAQGAKATGSHLRGRKYSAANVLDTTYDTYWAASDTNASITLTFDSLCTFDIIQLQEYIPLGQRVAGVDLLYSTDGSTYDHRIEDLCSTIGYKRLVRMDKPISCRSLILTLHGLAAPVINRVALYKR